jgi:activator of 2-hydroxyglutaryl-CoA dehydratase
MAYRVLALLEKINVEKELGITGGIAKNQGVVKRLKKKAWNRSS